jgi:nicotinate-nucleotide pyrophosphorylase
MREVVRRALEEDLGRGDVTTDATVMAGQRGHGVVVAKQDLVLAGLDVALEALRDCLRKKKASPTKAKFSIALMNFRGDAP